MVDAVCFGVAGGTRQGIVERSVGVATANEAVKSDRVVLVQPHDLTCVVYAPCNCANPCCVGTGHVEVGESPSAIEETVTAGGVVSISDNLAYVVDVDWLVAVGKRVSERKDCHEDGLPL